MTDKQKDIKIKTICNCCLICHGGTNNPNPFYICDKCKAKLKIGDSISRQEAVKPFLVDSTEEWTSADVVKYLKSLPPVTPAEKVGRWIEVKDDWGGTFLTIGGYKCSACECIVEDEKPLWKYCPNCGAKMEVSDADSN